MIKEKKTTNTNQTISEVLSHTLAYPSLSIDNHYCNSQLKKKKEKLKWFKIFLPQLFNF